MENINIKIVVAKKFVCETCAIIWSSNSNLKQHVKQVHNKIKEYKCDECEYECALSSSLKSHIKSVHNKVKDVSCNECNYRCSQTGQLKSHIKSIHLKVKDYKCDKCDYECAFKSSLKTHVDTIHNNMKDIKCIYCEFQCSSNSNLKQHVKSIHDNPKIKNMSRGESSVFNHLLESGYEFNKTFFREVSFNDLRGTNAGLLRYDFKVMIDDVKFVLIEFDGIQHFKPVTFNITTTAEEALANYKQTRTHDRIKNDYCSDNGIALLRIKYDQALLIGVMITEFIRIHS